MSETTRDQMGILQPILGTGRPLLTLTALLLMLSGTFALFLSATGSFLPHDVEYLGMNAKNLCAVDGCKIVHFMFHDRVAFGGALVAIGLLYMWLIEFPLRAGEAWAWWVLALSGAVGFASFLSYLSYGYLDTWHGVATLFLLPCFATGLLRSFRTLRGSRGLGSVLRPSVRLRPVSPATLGRLCLLAVAAGMIGGGLTISTVGMTSVFVPQDLEFMGLQVADLRRLNLHLVPLIAHDRAGFGGALLTGGLTVWGCVWCGRPSRSLWQVFALSGGIGFAAAIGVHFMIGYTSVVHLLPACAGAFFFVVGMILSFRPMVHGTHLRIIPLNPSTP